MEDPRIRKFAQFLIRSAVGLEKGEKILIELHGSETGLMKALVQEAYAVGGKPFVHIFDYAVEGALVQGADAEHMEEIASYELERMRDMDAYIDIRATTNISMWHNVSDEAQKRYRQYYWGPIHLAERCNHTKWSVLRYPNDAMAQLAGVSTEEYEDFYFRACLVDYDKMGRAMQPLQDLMARTDKVRIVAPGTDISFSIKGIPSFGMHGNRNIPDGEIYTSPVKNSVNGHITYNVPSPYDGFLFRDVYLEFKDGKIVKATSNNTDYMNEILDIDEGARYIGEFAFGVNPEINHPIGDILFDEKIAGSFHLTPGNSYDKVYSESDYHAGRTVTPSTDRQFDMAKLLVEELHGLGIENARYDDKCYVYATLDATPGCEQLPAIGLIAHMDTTPDMTGKDVKPQIIHYTGGDVVLNREQNIVMEAAQFPELQKFVGQELVCTDGTTLLGADDKAGIAIILQAVEELLAEKAPHGKICLGFTPDEEIGMGASFFDVSGFGADFAYTLDGGDITDYEYETFNAAKTVVTINGFSIHPGTSKDKMRNALLIAMEYNALLPALETPAHTEGYEGFFHLQEMHGKAEKATMEYIVRDHDMKRFQERKAMMDKAAEQINRRWGDGTAVVDTHDQYYNMYEVLKDHMEILELAESAMKAAGIEHPTHSPIRGGTDGSVLTYKGLLCPNLPSAGHNAHGRYEYAPVESLKTGVKTVKALVSPELVETIIGKKEG